MSFIVLLIGIVEAGLVAGFLVLRAQRQISGVSKGVVALQNELAAASNIIDAFNLTKNRSLAALLCWPSPPPDVHSFLTLKEEIAATPDGAGLGDGDVPDASVQFMSEYQK